MRISLLAALAAGALLVSACGEAKPDSNQVIELWKTAGLEVGEVETVDEHQLGEATCQRTTVDKLEATLCTYPSEEAAKAATKAGLEQVGKTTGTALSRGKVLLVVADRDNTDPEGKVINKLTKTFLGK